MTKEKRVQPRVDFRVEVRVELESRLQQFYSRNLSPGGIFLEVEGTPPPIGSTLKLSFDVPSLNRSVEVDAEVLHHHRFDDMDGDMHKFKKSGIGLKFTNLKTEDEKLISQFVRGKDLHVRS
jgi:c-di-GMP-binding flagellar brake protein YcgR